jgi:radical SAM superfamily enzyme YgiQ (UPF0313 family)
MAKVLFINPIVREEEEPKHVPMGIAQLAAIIIKKGHKVQVYDHNAWRASDEQIEDVLKSDAWDIVAIGGITTAYASIKKLVKLTRNLFPNVIIGLGGGVLTSIPKEIMSWLPEVDVGFIGESYVTFPEILSLIDQKQNDWKKIDGTISRIGNNEYYISPQRKLIENLDDLPYPAYDLFPLEEVYFKNSALMYSEEGMRATRRLDINASIGCSLVCKFCYHLGIAGDMRYSKDQKGNVTTIDFDKPKNYSRTIRYNSPEYVVKLAKFIKDKYDVNYVYFLDENLMTMDVYSRRIWMKEICKLWKEYDLVPKKRKDGTWSGLYWSGTSHATLCEPGVLKIMAEAGCAHLVYGYEHFDDRILKTMGKGSTRKTNIRSFFWTIEAGIRPIPNQIIGFPDEDFESLKIQMKGWDDLGVMVKPHFATAYPGSEWFTVFRKKILEQYKGQGSKLGLKDDLEAYILDLGDASRVSATISTNFNAVELAGLREIMVQRQYDKIDNYEQQWRKINSIKDGYPSTLVETEIEKFEKSKGIISNKEKFLTEVQKFEKEKRVALNDNLKLS